MNNMFGINKRACFYNNDENSLLLFKCDGCQLNKNCLRLIVDKTEKEYLCDYCIKN
jgi:hypothetical protein